MKLQAFLKWQGAADTGGQVKMVIQGGYVKVNGEVCTQRGHQLKDGDKVEFGGEVYVYQANRL
ncbi:RNA-binding S4 domain-containing protein [Scatolibacter rhodanostii]|uniref:RNA-binding S4 domain-containing protein n=1 Tax=Scatolibacter rhodanostii TaxID=2014781 RepID=UPI000C08A8AC|nr:RNA-binding S4 domain-containing protein [Scatolibacter rhodanostii]